MRLHTVVKGLFALDLLLFGISLPPKVSMLREMAMAGWIGLDSMALRPLKSAAYRRI